MTAGEGPGYDETREPADNAVSEVVSAVLLVFLVVVLSGVVFVVLTGGVPGLSGSTGRAVPEFGKTTLLPGIEVVTVHHRGGDPLKIVGPGGNNGTLVQLRSPGGVTTPAMPWPARSILPFGPGDTAFVYRDARGLFVTRNITARQTESGTAGEIAAFEKGLWQVQFIDTGSSLLVASGEVYLNGGTGPAPTTTPTPVPTPVPGMKGWWNFAGCSLADLSGSHYDGTGSQIECVEGRSGEALRFNGKNSTVTFQGSGAFSPVNAVTFEAWVNPSQQQSVKVIEKGDWNGMGIDQDRWQGWQAGVTVRSGGSYQKVKVDWAPAGTNRLVPLNTWTHVAVTYDNASLILYVNGKAEKSVPATGNLRSDRSQVVCAGSDAGAQKFFAGTLDGLAMYDRALSPAEVSEHASGTGPA